MAPYHSRQLLVWSLPTIAVLFSYLWYKKKRIGARSDTGDTENQQGIGNSSIIEKPLEKKEEEKVETKPVSTPSSPNRSFSRSLSGVESAPIDIVIPPSLRSTRSNPVVISDEDLDREIEKIKSMKNTTLSRSRSENSPTQHQSKTPSPLKEDTSPKTRSPSPLRQNTTTVKSKKSVKANTKQEPAEMAQKDIAVVEDKLTLLKINNNNKETPKKREHRNSTGKKEHEELQRQSSERDSANHSPADVMLASPSLSSISDNHSEGSSDSGKGGSDVATPPPSRTPGIDIPPPCDATLPTLYEFIIPQSLVGKLIGRHGSFVTQIKEKTNAHIVVKKHPTNNKLKVCSIEGTQAEIDKALKMIRDKFPAKRYPEVTLEQVHFTPIISTVPLIPDHLYLKLIEGINNDTILSCLVAPNHLFLQQPTHPSFPSLNLLSGCMNVCYTEANSPLLPNPIPENTVCSAYSVDAWYRAMVLSTDVETETSYVKFLDYGGYAYVENSKLRQIRGDFMLLPFQAAECVLANVKPLNEDGTWPEEAYSLVADITKGALIYTQVADYTDAGIPLVLCYVVVGPQSVVFLNQHLVDNGFAEWVPSDDTLQQDNVEGAVGGVNA